MRRLFVALGLRRAAAREVVGTDAAGTYVILREADGMFTITTLTEGRIRRHVEFHEAYDPKSMHPLWWQWAYRSRPEPPSEKDLALYDADQAALRSRVRAIERRDSKLALQHKAYTRDRDE